jgi:type II secretion system protein H
MNHFKSKKGFTLIEVMIVVAIIGIMAAIAIPNFLSWLDHYRVKGAARDIATAMHLAKMKAISQGVEYRVLFDLDNETFRLQKGNLASNSTAWTHDGALNNVHATVDIARVNSNTSGIWNKEFNPDGSSSSGSISITNTAGEQYDITLVPATGRIKLERMS